MSISANTLNQQQGIHELERTHQSTTYESFFDIWFADGPIYGAIHGCRLADDNKPDWKRDQPEWEYGRKRFEKAWADPDYFIGKGFNSRTSYQALDIDLGSPYHPANDRAAYARLLEMLEDIGLVRPVVVRSSQSGGLHLYFPLGQQVKTWSTARKLHDYLLRQGFTIEGGTLELFPNPKADRDAQYNALRLPLQLGSYLLDEDFEPWSGDRQDFLNAWNTAAAGNSLDFSPASIERREPVQKTHDILPPIAWTGSHQSNEVLRELANWGYEKEDLKTVPKLGDWMKEIAPRLAGFQQFTSKKSQRDIQADWCFRWARSRVRRGGGKAQSNFNLNEDRAEQATQRLKSVLADLTGQFWSSANKLFHKVCEVIQKRFGIGISKQTFQNRKDLWKSLLKAPGGPKSSSENQLEPIQRERTDKSPRATTQDPTKTIPTVDNERTCVQADVARDSLVHTPPEPNGSNIMSPVKRVTKTQLQSLPNPQRIMATGAELKQAGIQGYGLRHTWPIHRGEYSSDLWNRLRYVVFGGARC